MMVKLLIPLIVVVLGLAGTGVAEEVVLKNGDRISGKIVSETDEAVEIETVYAGVVRIDRNHIAKFSEPDQKREDATPALAVADKPKPVDKTEGTETPTVSPTSRRNRIGNHFASLVDGWEGNANIGFSFTSGNSNYTTLATGLRASKNIGNDKLNVYVRSLWNRNRGSGRMITTQNAFWGGGRYDRNINREVFGFVSYDFERDRPKRLNFRSVVGGGIGHHLVRSEKTQIELIAGGAWNRTWVPGPNTDTPEALAGSTLKHRFNDRLRVQKSFTYFQNVTEASTYRLLFDASVLADVTKRIGFFVTVGDRFNNDPVGTAKKNDFLFTTGMKWNFGKKK